MRKHIKLLAATVLVMALGSCEEYVDDRFQISPLPGFVEIDEDENEIDLQEEVTMVDSLRVTLPFTLNEDVRVTYTLGGTAKFGTNYTIEAPPSTPGDGYDGTTGTVTIKHRPEDDDQDYGTIIFRALDDNSSEEDLTATVTLTSAITASGKVLSVGKPKDEQIEGTVNIANYCNLDLNNFVGAYTVEASDSSVFFAGDTTYAVNISLVNSSDTIANDNFLNNGTRLAYVFSTALNTFTLRVVPTKFSTSLGEAEATGSGTYDPCDDTFEVDYEVALVANDSIIEMNTHTFTKK